MRGRRAIAVCSLVSSAAVGCTVEVVAPPSSSPHPTPTPPSAQPTGPLRAGIAQVDITPSPGLSILGHGPEGRVTVGVQQRLRCTPLVFRQAYERGEEVVALVPCDLGWSSLTLSRKVAARLAELEVPIGADRLLLSATHTHGGPAHYLAADNYSGALSSERPGYSEELVAFLTEKIAGGVETAYHDAESPDAGACVAWASWSIHDASATSPGSDPVPSEAIGKNRSLGAFSFNELGSDERALFLPGARPALTAIDGGFHVLRVDRCNSRGEHRALGAYAVVGVHPTAIPNTNDLFTADLFGYAAREAQTLIRASKCGDKDVLVGIANGVEGDVSPVIDAQGPREARRLGQLIGRRIHALWQGAAGPDACATLPPAPPLRVAYRELELRGARVSSSNEFHRAWLSLLWPWSSPYARMPSVGGEGEDAVLCATARIGTASAGGTDDGKTFFASLPGFREGAVAPRSTSCHAPKIELVTPGEKATAFPTRVPIFAALLGGRLMTTVPGEMTTLTAFRGRKQTESYLRALEGSSGDAAARAAREPIVQVGLTGEYLQYMTTPEEYKAQEYEGASSLYGPNEGRFLANQSLCLSRWLFESVSDASDQACALDHGVDADRQPQPPVGQVAELSFRPGAYQGPPAVEVCRAVEPGTFEPAAVTPSRRSGVVPVELGLTERDAEFLYGTARDGELGLGLSYQPPAGCRGAGYVPRVRVVDEHGVPIDDDEGDGLELRWSDKAWRIGWYPNERVRAASAGKSLRFVVEPGTKRELATGPISCPFKTP